MEDIILFLEILKWVFYFTVCVVLWALFRIYLDEETGTIKGIALVILFFVFNMSLSLFLIIKFATTYP